MELNFLNQRGMLSHIEIIHVTSCDWSFNKNASGNISNFEWTKYTLSISQFPLWTYIKYLVKIAKGMLTRK